MSGSCIYVCNDKSGRVQKTWSKVRDLSEMRHVAGSTGPTLQPEEKRSHFCSEVQSPAATSILLTFENQLCLLTAASGGCLLPYQRLSLWWQQVLLQGILVFPREASREEQSFFFFLPQNIHKAKLKRCNIKWAKGSV